MCNKGQAIRLADPVQQAIEVPGESGELTPGTKYQQMTFLRLSRLVMDLFAYQQKRLTVAIAVIVLDPVYQDIVVSDNYRIQTGA
jgi:hypothetical protein